MKLVVFASVSGWLLLLPSQSTKSPPAGFIDATAQSEIKFRYEASRTSEKYLIETMGGGVAVLDYDRDGLPDLYFVNGARLQDPMSAGKQPDKSDPRYWNRLYRNNGNGTFKDVTEKAGIRGNGYGMGVAVADYNNDGFPDLYITNFGDNILYRNNGDGTFTDVTKQARVTGGGWSTSACFFDYDRDGRLDLIVARYLDWDFSQNKYCGERRPGYRSFCHPNEFRPISHLLFHNNGDGTFTDVSRKAGFAAHPGKGLGVAFHDFNLDGWPDVVVANDSFPQQLFHNNGDGTFKETGLLSGVAYDEDGKTFAGMGVDFSDYNNDGWPDIVITALANQKYAFYRNMKGQFEYTSGPTGLSEISMIHSGWGMKFIDFDNDGWKDLFIGQGHVMDNIELTEPGTRYLESPLLLRNVDGKFGDVSRQSGRIFERTLAARGAAFGDLNNDGFVDIAINCNDQPAVILRNVAANGNHWLLVNTTGTRSNRDGIGARLRVISESGLEQHLLVSTAGSYLSASDKRVHIGLGRDRSVRLLEVMWPSGKVQRLTNIPADQILAVREPE